MIESFTLSCNNDIVCINSVAHNKLILKLEEKEWETKFFGRKFGVFTINHNSMETLNKEIINDAINALLKKADEQQYHILELQLDILGLNIVSTLEDKGFRLVDTKISFLTLMNKINIEPLSSKYFKVVLATIDDAKAILDLTSQSFPANKQFFSRFKNREYFSEDESRRYYVAWVMNFLNDKDTLFAVLKTILGKKVVGFFIYKKAGCFDGKPIYKGILTAVVPNYRGQQFHLLMQSFLYGLFPEEQFFIDNTTQLTNFATVKNHMRSQKRLKRIELIFYRRHPYC